MVNKLDVTYLKIRYVGVITHLLTFGILPSRDIQVGILAHRTSDDDCGVYNHLRNNSLLGAMKPFSVSVSHDPYKTWNASNIF